ncbi:MAG: inorganic phosphate transporter [Spirochaetia bacterium]|jgi:PiT family inorganic phosphate transporter|nr:inorganic phosphate transporter [Spirochaetia bacterium]
MISLFFLTSGLFLGWSLGANNTANVFGSAVGSGMVRFKTAAAITSIFVIIGSVLSGDGTGSTLESLGSVNQLAGAFIVAMAAAVSVYWMTRADIPVSITQSIVGSIVGWNIFSGTVTDLSSLAKILLSWLFSPILAAALSIIIYKMAKFILTHMSIHILKLDYYNRIGFIIVGAFGAYALGANNIAGVMGVFIPSSPFASLKIGSITLSPTDQLFLIGGLSIAAGVISYSGKVIKTVGKGITELTPVGGLVVVSASSLVLFIFASEGLESLLIGAGLPSIPLVPVSSSQAIVGAIVGLALIKGGRVNYRLVGKIGLGWIITPIFAGIFAFISLFVLQNVFSQNVYRQVRFMISPDTVQKLEAEGLYSKGMDSLNSIVFKNGVSFKEALGAAGVPENKTAGIMYFSEFLDIRVNGAELKKKLNPEFLRNEMAEAVIALDGKTFQYKWQFEEALAEQDPIWKIKPESQANKNYNRNLRAKLTFLYGIFSQ